MGKLFDIDGPLMHGLTLIMHLVVINLLTILFCIPLFTAGAAFTAMHDVVMRLHNESDVAAAKRYFAAFRQNFKKATLAWLPFLFSILLAVFYAYFFTNWKQSGLGGVTPAKVGVFAAAFLIFIIYLYVPPLMAKFENTVGNSLRNSSILMVAYFPRTLAMAAIVLVIWTIGLLNIALVPLYVAFGFSIPAYLRAYIYMPIFRKINPDAFGGPGDGGAAGGFEDAESEEEEAGAAESRG